MTKNELRLVLLECAEFFRDELNMSLDLLDEFPRLREKFEELKKKCYNALDNPTIADIERIRKFNNRKKQ